MAVEDSHREAAPGSSSAVEDERLIAEASAPPTLEEARESLVFWEKRLGGLHVYERAARQEAKEMADRSRQRVREAERARYGPSALQQLLDTIGIRHLAGRELVSVAKKALVVLALLLVVMIVAVIAFWSDIEPVLRDLIQLGGGSEGGG